MGKRRAYGFEMHFDLHKISCIILSYFQTFGMSLVGIIYFTSEIIYFQNMLWFA